MITYKEHINSLEWQKIKKEALVRDNFRCIKCGNIKNLEIHHVKYPTDFSFDTVDNVIVLCDKCHKEVHKKDIHKQIIRDLTQDKYDKMNAYDYARFLADYKDIRKMSMFEIRTWAKTITREITEKYNSDIRANSIINNGKHIYSLECWITDSELMYLPCYVSDLNVTHWMNYISSCPTFKIDTDELLYGNIRKEEQNKVRQMLKSGQTQKMIMNTFVTPYIEGITEKDEMKKWWQEVKKESDT